MEINCSYCEKCDTLWDDKEIENGLCFDCQEPVIKMVARPVVASQQNAQSDGTSWPCPKCKQSNFNAHEYCWLCQTSRR